MEHYKYRLDNFVNDEEINSVISGPIRRYLTFGQLKPLVSEALNELTKDSSTPNVKLPRYSDLLRSATCQYINDIERVKERAKQQLSDIKLTELESDLEALNRYLRS
ncbi:MAG: hypothetical protein ACHQ03_09695 [Candidatus Bathyarchaeia archaeon]